MRKEPREGEEDGREMLCKRYFIIKKKKNGTERVIHIYKIVNK